MAELTRGAVRRARNEVRLVPYDELAVNGEVIGVEAGKRKANFPGTDTLALNVMPSAVKWIESSLVEIVCGEGDRLNHIRFLDGAARAGYRVNLFVLSAPMSVLDERCAVRGSAQSRPWRVSRSTLCTRVAALAEEAGYQVEYLDATNSTTELANIVCEKVPAMQKLRDGALEWQ